jgi:hypothetical protein
MKLESSVIQVLPERRLDSCHLNLSFAKSTNRFQIEREKSRSPTSNISLRLGIDQSLELLEEIDFFGLNPVSIDEFSRKRSILGNVA